MERKTKTSFAIANRLGRILLLLMFLGHSAAAADPMPVDLGDLGGDPVNPLDSSARDINNAGQVVGESRTPSGPNHAFLWQQGVMQDLGSPIGGDSFAEAINDAGSIAGHAQGPTGPPRPWVYHGSAFTMLPIPAGTGGEALAIAPDEKVAGCIFSNSGLFFEIPVFWDPNTDPPYEITILTLYHGVSGCSALRDALGRFAVRDTVIRNGSTFPLNVSTPCGDSCDVLGLDVTGSGRMTGGDDDHKRALYWPNLDLLPAIPYRPTFCNSGNPEVHGFAVNEYGEIVGSASCPYGSGKVAYYWNTESESQRLPPIVPTIVPEGADSSALALNSVGGIVGQSSVKPYVRHATLWNLGAPPIP